MSRWFGFLFLSFLLFGSVACCHLPESLSSATAFRLCHCWIHLVTVVLRDMMMYDVASLLELLLMIRLWRSPVLRTLFFHAPRRCP